MCAGAISKWEKKVGDKCVPGDSIALVETDKASVSFDAQDEFFIAKLLVEEGQDVLVGAPILVTVEDPSHIAAFANYVHQPTKTDEKPTPAPAKVPKTPEVSSPLPKVEEAPKVTPTKPASTPAPPKPEGAKPKKPEAAQQSSSSLASSTLSQNWGESVKSGPLAGRLAVFQNEYVSKYGFTGHKPIELKVEKKEKSK